MLLDSWDVSAALLDLCIFVTCFVHLNVITGFCGIHNRKKSIKDDNLLFLMDENDSFECLTLTGEALRLVCIVSIIGMMRYTVLYKVGSLTYLHRCIQSISILFGCVLIGFEHYCFLNGYSSISDSSLIDSDSNNPNSSLKPPSMMIPCLDPSEILWFEIKLLGFLLFTYMSNFKLFDLIIIITCCMVPLTISSLMYFLPWLSSHYGSNYLFRFIDFFGIFSWIFGVTFDNNNDHNHHDRSRVMVQASMLCLLSMTSLLFGVFVATDKAQRREYFSIHLPIISYWSSQLRECYHKQITSRVKKLTDWLGQKFESIYWLISPMIKVWNFFSGSHYSLTLSSNSDSLHHLSDVGGSSSSSGNTSSMESDSSHRQSSRRRRGDRYKRPKNTSNSDDRLHHLKRRIHRSKHYYLKFGRKWRVRHLFEGWISIELLRKMIAFRLTFLFCCYINVVTVLHITANVMDDGPLKSEKYMRRLMNELENSARVDPGAGWVHHFYQFGTHVFCVCRYWLVKYFYLL